MLTSRNHFSVDTLYRRKEVRSLIIFCTYIHYLLITHSPFLKVNHGIHKNVSVLVHNHIYQYDFTECLLFRKFYIDRDLVNGVQRSSCLWNCCCSRQNSFLFVITMFADLLSLSCAFLSQRCKSLQGLISKIYDHGTFPNFCSITQFPL